MHEQSAITPAQRVGRRRQFRLPSVPPMPPPVLVERPAASFLRQMTDAERVVHAALQEHRARGARITGDLVLYEV